MASFDWYQATIPTGVDDVLEALCGLAEGVRLSHGRGQYGFAHETAVASQEGRLAKVWHGGTHAYPHVLLSGEPTQAGVEVIRAQFPEHLVTRADACVDFDDQGAFDRILPVMLSVAEAQRVKVRCQGDWALTMEARTITLGAPSSATQQRLYDKAAERRAKFASDPVKLATVPEHLARLEAQVRPQTRESRTAFATIEPLAVMGSSRWLREVWKGVAGLDLEPVQVGKVWRQSDDDRAYAYLLAQYGALLRRKHEEQGSWECVGLQIGHDLAERDQVKRRSS